MQRCLAFISVIFIGLGHLFAQVAEEADTTSFIGLSPASEEDAVVVKVDSVPYFTYEQIQTKISQLASGIPLNYNRKVHGFIDYFTVRNRDYTRMILSRKDHFFDIFDPYIKQYNLPDELKYLAIIESGLKTGAISRANAVGLWQFIYSTGKIYGLQANWYVDERMDPFLATDAACRHLRDLYNMFGDWELALAAYNCGPGNVKKAMRRSGKQKFWDIYAYLPRETRSYVPQFVAMIYAIQYAKDHALYAEETYAWPAHDTVLINQYLHFDTFANLANMCVDDLQMLNPMFKRGAIPDNGKSYAFRLPVEVKQDFELNKEFWLDSAGKAGKDVLAELAMASAGSISGREKITYRVKSGDNLSMIAQRYKVSVNDLRQWNNISGSQIYVGQALTIWVLPSQPSSTQTAVSSTPKIEPGKNTYLVQSGDTLWSIAKSANLTIEQLKSINKLSSNTIYPGQSLIISAQ